VFSEENMRMNETFGKSSDNFVKVQGDFKIKYSVDINRVRTKYDFDKKEVIFQVPKDAVGVDSVELMGKVREIERHETWIEKLKDIFNNDNEIIKENAINQLLENSKLQAQDYDANELQQKARKSMEEIINTINANNLKYRIEFVDNTTIGIK
jgi:exonuclease I